MNVCVFMWSRGVDTDNDIECMDIGTMMKQLKCATI